MVLLDLDAAKAATVANEHGGGQGDGAQASTRATSTRSPTALAGADVLLNTASYRINLDAMRACLKAGCHYLDLGGLYHMTLAPARAVRASSSGPGGSRCSGSGRARARPI